MPSPLFLRYSLGEKSVPGIAAVAGADEGLPGCPHFVSLAGRFRSRLIGKSIEKEARVLIPSQFEAVYPATRWAEASRGVRARTTE